MSKSDNLFLGANFRGIDHGGCNYNTPIRGREYNTNEYPEIRLVTDGKTISLVYLYSKRLKIDRELNVW
jgi:hypothetical protein